MGTGTIGLHCAVQSTSEAHLPFGWRSRLQAWGPAYHMQVFILREDNDPNQQLSNRSHYGKRSRAQRNESENPPTKAASKLGGDPPTINPIEHLKTTADLEPSRAIDVIGLSSDRPGFAGRHTHLNSKLLGKHPAEGQLDKMIQPVYVPIHEKALWGAPGPIQGLHLQWLGRRSYGGSSRGQKHKEPPKETRGNPGETRPPPGAGATTRFWAI